MPGCARIRIEAFRGELERAATIGAEFLVLHPGNYKGQSVEEGVTAFVLGLKEAAESVHHDVRNPVPTVLLENTAGSGASLGSRFEELQSMRELARDLTDLEVGYCLDTCHLLAAGFDIATARGLRQTIASIEQTIRPYGGAPDSCERFQDSAGLARGPACAHRERLHRARRIPANPHTSKITRQAFHSGNADRPTGRRS